MLVDGRPVAFVERGGRSLVTFDGADASAWVETLVDAVRSGRLGPMELIKIDGAPAPDSPIAPTLLAAGFVRGYKGLVLRRERWTNRTR